MLLSTALIMGTIIFVGLAAYWFGYHTARPSHHRKIVEAYHRVFLSNEELKRMPAGQAMDIGFAKGYQQAIEDAQVHLSRMGDDSIYTDSHASPST